MSSFNSTSAAIVSRESVAKEWGKWGRENQDFSENCNARKRRKDSRMIITVHQVAFTRENTVIKGSQEVNTRDSHARGNKAEITRLRFQRLESRLVGRNDGQKRDFVAARACLIVQGRTVGS